ncbi:hypothetical protein I9W82_005258 [Candida metapsilosis]|uniref:Uncharacterized protein n=1 Tax=Candida metapsilosis TaxID=273372 RepID=A0A8H8D9Y5_9ASCO|nr:hypothetical protein I9W82_005258 [Candida metapsilosis]
MTELYFLRHGERIDHALQRDPEAKPIIEEYHAYDPSLATTAIPQLQQVVEDICATTEAFQDKESSLRKNVYIHFSPYLRCCQTADLLITDLKAKFSEQFPNYKVRFQLLGDFALSEWVHDKMTNKPPFVDSNDAYNMYTPNLKTLKNKNACSNFRPTVTLGQYNGPNLTYKEYQARCKEYFQKLLATYDKPTYIKNNDIIIVVSHGYLINNLMSYFINHPIFEEIPEAKINLARRLKKEEVKDDEFDPKNYYWKLVKDALGIAREDVDTTLNLETDIVYYKTNFIKKDDLIDKPKDSDIKDEYKPRASFKIESTSASRSVNGLPPARHNYLCPAAKDWVPDKKHFQIRSEFKEKMMNCEAFKKGFAITNPPSRRVSPDVSPNSAPTKNNSVIDLSKILSNESVQPIKLKYSNTSEIPIHRLNSRVNSQVNLQQYNRPTSSAENSTTDLPKYVSTQLQNRSRSGSNPNSSVVVAHHTKDSYFPQVINRIRSNESDMSVDSISDQSVDELDIIKEHHEPPISAAAAAAAAAAANRSSPIETLNRARSLNKKRINNPLFLSYQQKKSQNQLPQSFTMQHDSNNSNSSDDEYEDSGSGSDEDMETGSRPLSLSFKNNQGKPAVVQKKPNSLQFYSTLSNEGKEDDAKKPRPFFYNFETDGDDSDSDDYSKSSKENTSDGFWFGKNK